MLVQILQFAIKGNKLDDSMSSKISQERYRGIDRMTPCKCKITKVE